MENIVGTAGKLATSLTTFYVAGFPCLIKELSLCGGAVDATWTAHIVPSGGTADVTNRIFNAETISAGSSLPYSRNTAMNVGDTLKVMASIADTVTLTMTLVEFAE